MKTKLLILLIACCSIYNSNAQTTFPGDNNIMYEVISGTTTVKVISGENCPEESLNIPNTVMHGAISYTVTAIDFIAFSECSDITGLTLPDTVTSIGGSAFFGCSSLTDSLIIPDSVISIGEGAFEECSGFTSVTIGESVTSIGNFAFEGCSGLTGDLTLPESVTSIGDKAFKSCTGLTGDLTLPDNITSIGVEAFRDCTGLTGTLTIGEKVTSIDSFAFAGCDAFTTCIVKNPTAPSANANSFGSWNTNAELKTPPNATGYDGVSPWKDFKSRTTLSTESITNKDFKVTASPNPASNLLHINADTNITDVVIYNLIGQKVLEQQANSTSVSINIENLENALYLIEISSKGKRQLLKVIKE